MTNVFYDYGLSDGSFLLKKIIGLDYSINMNILLTVGV